MEEWMIGKEERAARMPWDAVDTVVFDIGNVLMRFDPSYILKRLFDSAHKRSVLMETVFRSPLWPQIDRGTLSCADAPRVLAGDDTALAADVAHLLAHWCEHKPPIVEGFDAVRACKAHGKRLCLLSNYPREAFEWLAAHYDVFSLFDVRLVSCYVHMLKPEAQMYQALIGVAGINPARSLFVDDMEANVLAARDAGMKALHYRKEGQLRAFFLEQA